MQSPMPHEVRGVVQVRVLLNSHPSLFSMRRRMASDYIVDNSEVECHRLPIHVVKHVVGRAIEICGVYIIDKLITLSG